MSWRREEDHLGEAEAEEQRRGVGSSQIDAEKLLLSVERILEVNDAIIASGQWSMGRVEQLRISLSELQRRPRPRIEAC